MDYGEVLDAPLVFPPCKRRSCVDIPIVDDDVLENSELFNVSLERNGLDSRITLDPVDGLVEITGMCTVPGPCIRPSVVWLIMVHILCVWH